MYGVYTSKDGYTAAKKYIVERKGALTLRFDSEGRLYEYEYEPTSKI